MSRADSGFFKGRVEILMKLDTVVVVIFFSVLNSVKAGNINERKNAVGLRYYYVSIQFTDFGFLYPSFDDFLCQGRRLGVWG